MKIVRTICLLSVLAMGLMSGGCVLKPAEASEQTTRLADTARRLGYGSDSTTPRAVPELPARPEWRDVLQRAFLANGDLEAAYHEWAMAVQRIDQAGTWPSQPIELGFDYMFSGEQMKAFDRTTVSIGLMDATALPQKTYQAAKVSWREAQAAGERFRAAKFALQNRVLQAWADYTLQAERVRIQEQNRELLTLVANTAASRVRAGGPQQEQLRADVELRLAENELASARAELEQQRIRLNGLLVRPADAPLAAPASLPAPRRLLADDDALLAAGASNNADLAGLGFDRAARRAAIARARMEYWPEVNPMAAFTGSISQSAGAAISLPTQWPRIGAMVAEARADLRRVEASARQARADRAASFLATLLAMRDAERRTAAFEQEIIPLAERTVALARQSYSSGVVSYLELIDAQRTLLDARLLLAEARTTREKMLAELESLAGVDAETLEAQTKTPSTQEVR